MYWQNTVDGYCDGKEKLCDKIVEFVNKNTAWVKGKNLWIRGLLTLIAMSYEIKKNAHL